MRPPGDIARALLDHADTPCPVRELCTRAQVGYDAGRYTATRMVQRGELVVLEGEGAAVQPSGPGRPARLVVARSAVTPPAGQSDSWQALYTSFWDQEIPP